MLPVTGSEDLFLQEHSVFRQSSQFFVSVPIKLLFTKGGDRAGTILCPQCWHELRIGQSLNGAALRLWLMEIQFSSMFWILSFSLSLSAVMGDAERELKLAAGEKKKLCERHKSKRTATNTQHPNCHPPSQTKHRQHDSVSRNCQGWEVIWRQNQAAVNDLPISFKYPSEWLLRDAAQVLMHLTQLKVLKKSAGYLPFKRQ